MLTWGSPGPEGGLYVSLSLLGEALVVDNQYEERKAYFLYGQSCHPETRSVLAICGSELLDELREA
jgi:hypothetical protein